MSADADQRSLLQGLVFHCYQVQRKLEFLTGDCAISADKNPAKELQDKTEKNKKIYCVSGICQFSPFLNCTCLLGNPTCK